MKPFPIKWKFLHSPVINYPKFWGEMDCIMKNWIRFYWKLILRMILPRNVMFGLVAVLIAETLWAIDGYSHTIIYSFQELSTKRIPQQFVLDGMPGLLR